MCRIGQQFVVGYKLQRRLVSRKFTVRSQGSSAGRKSASADLFGKPAFGPVDGTVPGDGVITQPPKGTRDFYPSDVSIRNWLQSHWRRTARRFGFEEYDAPILESEQLYIRKAGEEITDQLYNFVDKGERRVSLRPEMTPSLARMVLSKGTSLALPLKWFSVPQCWRYERMSRGRRREHYQWNMDIWGVPGVQAEAELIAAAVSCMMSMGLSSADVGIKVNNRKLLNEVMDAAGVPSTLWAPACVVVDKRDKLPPDVIEKQLSDLGLSAATVASLLAQLGARHLSEVEDSLGRRSEGAAELRALLSWLRDGYGIGEDWVSFDFSVVRGLAYYTGTVFEGADKAGKLRAICGGGRYDSLYQIMGGQRAIPAAGFGFGDAVIMELLADKGLTPLLDLSAADVVVFAWEESLRCRAIAVASQLRAAGLRVDLILEEGKRLKSILQRANKAGASALVMLAPEEDSMGTSVVRDLKQGSQTTQSYADLPDRVGTIVRCNQAPQFEALSKALIE